MGYRIPVKIPEQFNVSNMTFALEHDDIIKYEQDIDRLFVFLPNEISDTSVLGTYNAVTQYPSDKIIGKINGFIFTPVEISVDFELFERTIYGPMIKYLFSDIIKCNPHMIPSLIYDSQTNEIKQILGFTLWLNQLGCEEPKF